MVRKAANPQGTAAVAAAVAAGRAVGLLKGVPVPQGLRGGPLVADVCCASFTAERRELGLVLVTWHQAAQQHIAPNRGEK